jgi:mRNA interferase RelE/StbE
LPKVEWTDDAIEDLEKLSKAIAKRTLNKITWLSNNFNIIIPEALSGDFAGMFKLRVGDWRVIYTIENEIIVIQAIGHRREVYK